MTGVVEINVGQIINGLDGLLVEVEIGGKIKPIPVKGMTDEKTQDKRP